jgi:hypothetical protein
MLTGRHLFEPSVDSHQRAGSVLMRHRRETPPPLSSIRSGCSQFLERTLLRMLAKQPEARFQSMDELIAELRKEQNRLGFGNRIFLSYRRDDSFDATHRLYDHLAPEFGENSLVMDIDSIPPGEDFRQFISESVQRASAVLVVIGDHWLTVSNSSGGRRIDNEDDFVRVEIETAEQFNKTIIPVLVGRAEMPPADLLPDSLRFLSFRNAAEVRSGKGYSEGVKRLVSRLNDVMSREPR